MYGYYTHIFMRIVLVIYSMQFEIGVNIYNNLL